MRRLRFRNVPPVGLFVLAGAIGLFPALYLFLFLTHSAPNDRFHTGPVWVLACTVPLYLLRREAVLDVGRRRVGLRWGLWIPGFPVLPVFWRRYSLDGVSAVHLKTESRSSGKNHRVVFAVRLDGPGTPLLADRSSALAARRLAERAARGLGVPLTDTTQGGQPVTRPAESLSKSLGQRVRDGEVASPDPRRPEWSDLVVRTEDGALRIERPPVRRFGSVVIPTYLFYGLINLVIGVEFALGGPAHPQARIAVQVIWGVFGALSLVALVMSVEEATVQWRVELTSDRVRIHRKSWIVRGSRQMSLADLEEIHVDKGVRLISDDARIDIGADLDREEQEWLRAAVLRHLSGKA